MGKGARGRPSKEYVDSLRGLSQKDYTLLEKACVEAFLNKATHVILALSHLTKLADDFPNTTIVRKEGKKVYVKVRANLLLRWLNKHGYSQFTSEDIRVEQIRFTVMKEKAIGLQELDWHGA